jgi:uncharacterized protein YecE (DUF72 family)
MSKQHRKIHIGTSGWSYEHWKGPFYPHDLTGSEMLTFYAQHFRSVEINSSFYRLPEKNTLQHWYENTPDDFLFAAKASRYITHMKKLREPRKTVPVFLKRIALLGDKLGPILFQLPPRWQFNASRLHDFIVSLSPEFHYAFEFRDHSWLNQQVFDLLAGHNMALCIYQLEGYTSPAEITADWTYVRLHGPDAAYQGSYGSRALSRWSDSIARWAKGGNRVYCYFDNDQAGYAAANAGQLDRMLSQ